MMKIEEKIEIQEEIHTYREEYKQRVRPPYRG